MWYIYTMEYYLALKRKEPETGKNMGEPWRNYAKWNKLITKGQILYISTYLRYSE